jgi:polyisoprenoid-binding protein YceI
VTGQIRNLNPAIKVVAADGDADEDIAEVLGGLIRHIESEADAASIYEQAAESAAACGIGHWRARTQFAEGDTFDQEISESDAYFNSAAFPAITFKSTEVTTTGHNTGTVTGDLTFRGVTKPVTLDVLYNGTASFPWAPDQPKIGFSATGSLKRSDFGMDILVPSVSDEVDLLIEVEFAKAAEASESE